MQLEFSPSVVNFQFKPGSKATPSNSSVELTYHFEVVPAEGMPELHYLRTEGHSVDYLDKVRAAVSLKYEYKEFNDDNWLPQKEKILPLLKVSSFLSGGRHVFLPPNLMDAAAKYIGSARKGSLGGYMSSLSGFDSNLCLLVFCRMYSERRICVDFRLNFFCKDTLWWVNE